MSANAIAAATVGLTSYVTVFIGLKLCHVIDWSWWWVLSPLWIYAVVVLQLIAVAVLVSAWRDRRR